MADKKDPETETKEGEKEPLPVRLVAGPEPPAVAHVRSDTEQAIIDTYGDDPEKHKEGSRERSLVESLPENVAKKQREEEEKKKEKKKK
jgi:hypothetical protein